MDPIEALKHVRTFLRVMSESDDVAAIHANIREAQRLVAKALPEPVRGSKPRKGSWSAEDLARLAALAESGATVTRAAGALNRSTASVQTMARRLGAPLVGTREVRAKTRSAEQTRSK